MKEPDFAVGLVADHVLLKDDTKLPGAGRIARLTTVTKQNSTLLPQATHQSSWEYEVAREVHGLRMSNKGANKGRGKQIERNTL